MVLRSAEVQKSSVYYGKVVVHRCHWRRKKCRPKKSAIQSRKMPSKEELLFNMEKLLPVSEKWENAIQWRFAIQLRKDSVCLKKMKKRAILSRKRSSKEELLFNMENVPSVSKSAIDNEKISYNERAQKCHPKRKKCHPRKSIIYNKKRYHKMSIKNSAEKCYPKQKKCHLSKCCC